MRTGGASIANPFFPLGLRLIFSHKNDITRTARTCAVRSCLRGFVRSAEKSSNYVPRGGSRAISSPRSLL